MSASPPKEPDVEQNAHSGEEQDHMDREQEGAQGAGLDFEVKEQDRWLPIANALTGAASGPLRERCQRLTRHNKIPNMPSSSSEHERKPLSSSSKHHGGRSTSSSSSSMSAMSDANIRNFAPVARIMKTALPDNAKIAKEAKECMQECVSEFISFITSEASEKCQQEKRKTVNGEDILFAMTSLGFENYAEALKIYLSKYRETQSTRGENQNRPTSSGGYGGGVGPGNVQGNAATGPPGYPGGQPDNATELLNQGHGMNANDHDATGPYGYPSAVSSGHNGIASDNF
ncbi:nuclear transcription factor Y subunit beta [Fonsecaea nubica]|uniref:Nuclear transcription factor Y subunit beta n=1 Tax=Fonsecaea nubica TaxID=856822 RepID=A0A178CE24_9EURO|nr:nuclear transcription factor Y subunit beta [Fonsecaea nubica]OAL28210.1 nuclear transcription factor Y subunit beta [Fonsecaea nubica]